MVSACSSGNCNTVNVLPPQEYAKYSYAVDINGKKQMASVEKTPNGEVTIKVGDGENVQEIKTDEAGLLDFNQKYMQKADLYSNDAEAAGDKKSGWTEKGAAALRNLLAARMLMGGVNNSADQNNLTAMQMHQQAVDAALMSHNTAVQMSTPGMGII